MDYAVNTYTTSPVAQMVKRLPAMRETRVQSLGRGDALEEEMATCSSVLAWEIPRIQAPGGLQSTGSRRAKPNWAHAQHSLPGPFVSSLLALRAFIGLSLL